MTPSHQSSSKMKHSFTSDQLLPRSWSILLSEGFGELKSLEILSLFNCYSLTALPEGTCTFVLCCFIWNPHNPYEPPLNLGPTVTPMLNHSTLQRLRRVEAPHEPQPQFLHEPGGPASRYAHHHLNLLHLKSTWSIWATFEPRTN